MCESIVNFISSIKKGSNLKLLPVSSRQCFIFTAEGSLLGCIVLGDLTYYVGDIAGHEIISAHEYINEALDDGLTEWDYLPFCDVTEAHWLNLVSYIN